MGRLLEYESLISKDTYIGKKEGFVAQTIGTALWFFISTQIDFFNMGTGYNWGVGYIITSSIFGDKSLNAWDSLQKMWLVEKFCLCDFALEFASHILAGLLSFNLFTYLGFSDLDKMNVDFSNEDVAKFINADGKNGFSNNGHYDHTWLLISMILFFRLTAAGNWKNNESRFSPEWLFNILALGVTFSIAGNDTFYYAPNRVFACSCSDFVTSAKWMEVWQVYVMYFIYGMVARVISNLWDCNGKFDQIWPPTK